MSWSTSKIVDSAEAVDAIEIEHGGNKGGEVLEQLAAAKAAAKALIESGVVGAGGKEYSVSLSGHANPGHEPAVGWANDCVTVNVAQFVRQK